MSHHKESIYAIGNKVMCVRFCGRQGRKADVKDKRHAVLLVTPTLFTSFTSVTPFLSHFLPLQALTPSSISSQAGFDFTMACWDWKTATMIGGLFIYNHKGEVLISRVYRDDIGYVSFDTKLLWHIVADYTSIVVEQLHLDSASRYLSFLLISWR